MCSVWWKHLTTHAWCLPSPFQYTWDSCCFPYLCSLKLMCNIFPYLGNIVWLFCTCVKCSAQVRGISIFMSLNISHFLLNLDFSLVCIIIQNNGLSCDVFLFIYNILNTGAYVLSNPGVSFFTLKCIINCFLLLPHCVREHQQNGPDKILCYEVENRDFKMSWIVMEKLSFQGLQINTQKDSLISLQFIFNISSAAFPTLY